MQPFGEQHISKRNYEITVVQRFIFPDKNYKDGPLEFVASFSKVYLWDWGLANSFWEHLIQISIRQIFSIYFPNYDKFKSFVGKFISYYQTFIFEEQLCMYNIFLQLITNQTQINSVEKGGKARES